MADQLGQVELLVTVNDRRLEADLERVRQKALAAGRAAAQSYSQAFQASAGGIGGNASGGRISGSLFPQLNSNELRSTQQSLGGVATAATATRASVAAIAASAVGAAAALTGIAAAAGSAASNLIQLSGESQRLNASLKALSGSEGGAQQLRQDLFELSQTTPFPSDELVRAGRRFLSVGINAENLKGTINRLGALAIQSGTRLERLGLIYAQVFSKGRLQGEELLQFQEAGVGITQQLEQVTGLYGAALFKAISQGKVGIDELNAALVLATGNLSALVEGGNAVDAAFSTLNGNIEQVQIALGNALAPAFKAVADTINAAFANLFPNLQSIQSLFEPLNQAAKDLADTLSKNPAIVEGLTKALDSLITTGLQVALDTVENINKALKENPQGVLNVVADIELFIRRALIGIKGISRLVGQIALNLSDTFAGRFDEAAKRSRQSIIDLANNAQQIFKQKRLDLTASVSGAATANSNSKGPDGSLQATDEKRVADEAKKAAEEAAKKAQQEQLATVELQSQIALQRESVRYTQNQLAYSEQTARILGQQTASYREIKDQLDSLNFRQNIASSIAQAAQQYNQARQKFIEAAQKSIISGEEFTQKPLLLQQVQEASVKFVQAGVDAGNAVKQRVLEAAEQLKGVISQNFELFNRQRQGAEVSKQAREFARVLNESVKFDIDPRAVIAQLGFDPRTFGAVNSGQEFRAVGNVIDRLRDVISSSKQEKAAEQQAAEIGNLSQKIQRLGEIIGREIYVSLNVPRETVAQSNLPVRYES